VGDSRTLLVKDGTSIQLSEDAKLHDLNYKEAIQQRITEAKNKGLIQSGSVEEVIKSENGSSEVRIQINRYGRNDRRDPQAYSLGVAQTLGDKYYEGILSAEPNIIAYPLQEATGGYLVLACDGLWDVASTRQIGDAINEMDALELTYQKMAESLVYSAVQSGSTDNLSVIVAQL
jgi:serine/threonine protein phosphatase PrpC